MVIAGSLDLTILLPRDWITDISVLLGVVLIVVRSHHLDLLSLIETMAV